MPFDIRLQEDPRIVSLCLNCTNMTCNHGTCAQYRALQKTITPRKPVTHEIDGVPLTIQEIARRYHISASTLYHRLTQGFTIEQAVTQSNDHVRKITAYGKSLTVKQWAYELHLTTDCINRRLLKMSPEEALVPGNLKPGRKRGHNRKKKATLPENPTFGQRLTYLMHLKGDTIAELAAYMHCGNRRISDYRRDLGIPRLEDCVAIAERYGVTLDWLAGKDGHMKDGEAD